MKNNIRKQHDLDIRYMRMANIWAENSYCVRRKVGALIVKDKMIISAGYTVASDKATLFVTEKATMPPTEEPTEEPTEPSTETATESPTIIDLVCNLCRLHQQSGFIAALKFSHRLSQELNT